AASCAIDSPEPLSVIVVLMPVSFSNSTATRLHQSACTEQMTLSWFCAVAGDAATTATAAAAASAECTRFDIELSSRGFLLRGYYSMAHRRAASGQLEHPARPRRFAQAASVSDPAGDVHSSEAATPSLRRQFARSRSVPGMLVAAVSRARSSARIRKS